MPENFPDVMRFMAVLTEKLLYQHAAVIQPRPSNTLRR